MMFAEKTVFLVLRKCDVWILLYGYDLELFSLWDVMWRLRLRFVILREALHVLQLAANNKNSFQPSKL